MIVNSVSQSNAISSYINNVNTKPVTSTAKAEITDSVELSDGAQKYATLLKAAKESMDNSSIAEETKVADIMAKMNDSTYKVPTGDVVSGILSGIPTHI